MTGRRRGLIWVAGGAAAGVAITLTLLALARLRGTSQASSIAPILTVIPVTSVTAPVILSPTASLLPTQTPTALPGAPNNFTTGELVQIFGTEGEGLRMRSNPNLGADVLLLGLESEVFEVIEGPTASDGYTWWRLANPFDPSKQGWAADQFLRSLDGAP